MTLRMGDGPIANLPAGLDAYAGYTDNSGIGVTFPAVVAKFPAAKHLSISVHGQAPADVGDVESGALASWKGYTVGYCAISNAQALINRDGRPQKLWTAHYTNTPHICNPSCGFGFTGTADGTQWTDHGGVWDESLLAADFFTVVADPPPPVLLGDEVKTYNLNGALFVSNGLMYRYLTSMTDYTDQQDPAGVAIPNAVPMGYPMTAADAAAANDGRTPLYP